MTIMYIIKIVTIMSIITLITVISIAYVSSVDTSAQSNVFDPVSVCAVAVKRSKPLAYQTESGKTMEAPVSIPGGQIIIGSDRWLPWNGLAGNGLQYTRCTPLYLVWPSTKQLYSEKRPLRSAESVSSNVSSRAFTCTIITIITITPIIQTTKKKIFGQISAQSLLLSMKLEHRSTPNHWSPALPLDQRQYTSCIRIVCIYMCLILIQMILMTIITIIEKITIISIISILLAIKQIQKDLYLIVIDPVMKFHVCKNDNIVYEQITADHDD